MDWTQIMKYAIVVMGFVVCYAEVRQAIQLRGKPWAWVKYALAFMGLYWSGYYIRSIVGVEIGSTHQIWVRSPLFLTLLFIACGAIMSLRRVK